MDGLSRPQPVILPVVETAQPAPMPIAAPAQPRSYKPHLLTLALSVAVLSATPIYNYLQQPHVAFDQLVIKTINIVHPQPTASVNWTQVDTGLPGIINSTPGIKVGVSVVDLTTGKQTNYGEQSAFTAASTTKVITAIAYLRLVEQGKASLSDQLGGNTADWQIRQMIQRSNNDSWALLNAKIGTSSLQKMAPSLGANSFKYIGNQISAPDDAAMLANLYRGKLLNPDHTSLLLGYMQNTNNEQLIAGAALPASADVYHKYGQLDDKLHDTAIIKIDGKPLVLTIFTSGSGDYTSRANLIHQITEAVITK